VGRDDPDRRFLSEQEGKAIPNLLDRPRDILVMGSTVGRHISPFSSMYGSTKFAANSLAEAARRELGPKGIRVSLIEPGFVESEFQGVAGYDPKWFEEVKTRIGPVLQPPDIARLVTTIVSQPAHVHMSDVLIRPTRQEYP
jgi:NADP-dependent 3-hydroxy acid dehydrogenase YdfG